MPIAQPVLQAYAAGLADADQKRQARAHLAHCRDCSDFVARLTGHLHDLGGAVAVPGVVDGLDGHLSIGARFADLSERAREEVSGLLSRGGSSGADEAASQVAAAGGVRGAGVAGAGVLAKLAGLGTAGKLAVACVGAAAVVPCVNALTGDRDQPRPAIPAERRGDGHRPAPPPDLMPTQVGNQPAAAPTPGFSAAPEARPPQPSEPESSPAADASQPVPVEQAPDFGLQLRCREHRSGAQFGARSGVEPGSGWTFGRRWVRLWRRRRPAGGRLRLRIRVSCGTRQAEESS